MEEPIHG